MRCNFGEILQSIRKHRGYSIENISKELGINKNLWIALEKDELFIKKFSEKTGVYCDKIARALKLSEYEKDIMIQSICR